MNLAAVPFVPALTSIPVCRSVIAELEKKLKSNEERMERQHMELDDLKNNVTAVRDEIRKQVQYFSTC